MLLDVSRDLGQFTLADERFRRRVGQPLSKPFDRSDPGRLGQKLQFVEVFHGLPFLLLIPDHRDQHGFAGGNYRFVFLFHKFKKGASPRGRNTLPRLSRTRLNLPQIYKKYRRKKASARFFRHPVLQILKICLYLSPEGGLAQLARALAWHARGHQFDPGILHNPGKDGHKSILIFLSESVPCIHKYPPLSSCSDRAQTGRGTIRIRTKPRAGSARAKKTAIGRKKNAITSNTGQ